MSSHCLSCFQALLFPAITEVKVVLFENLRVVDISTYSEKHQDAVIQAIQKLWFVEEKSDYWFETTIQQKSSCFERRHPEIYVTCYKKDMLANEFKKKMAIPMKYRRKMFDQYHMIWPKPSGSQKWPQEMSVRFRLDK
jgi:hypothetical protein